MMISTRNQIDGTIEVKTPSGDIISSIITNKSVDNMLLKEGDSVVAIIKATDLMIVK